METKKPFAERAEAFFAGRGFYIVLALCLTVIGVSVWATLSASRAESEVLTGLPVAEVTDAPAVAVSGRPPLIPEVPAVQLPEETAAPAAQTPKETAKPASGAAELPEDPLPVMSELRVSYVWPVTGDTERPYAVETLSYDPTMLDWRSHDGIDVGAPLGTPVRAAAQGTVVRVYDDDELGTTVIVQHPDGLSSLYANLAALPTVREGEIVSMGQVIGSVGATARCEIGEAAHLHFAVCKAGESIDPTSILPG